VGVPGGLDEYLRLLEEAEKRDHRKLGNELDLFSFPDEIGSGLAVFHPKGGIIRRRWRTYSRRRHEEEGYEFVYSPHITKGTLFESRAPGLVPRRQCTRRCTWTPSSTRTARSASPARTTTSSDDCPFHDLIFRSRGRSYRELPLRMFEFGSVYRYEKSGVIHGLTRVRGMTQDDAHIFCTPSRCVTS